ncbi:hypothetical protein VKT23_015534 [Stygiomarasmius scandens]|uniref:C2H2-type domain-containing protein n=1 Tax=Marasmiellus scandens TaxID=2682957 RepID=A0ABR1IX83_9AGAR
MNFKGAGIPGAGTRDTSHFTHQSAEPTSTFDSAPPLTFAFCDVSAPAHANAFLCSTPGMPVPDICIDPQLLMLDSGRDKESSISSSEETQSSVLTVGSLLMQYQMNPGKKRSYDEYVDVGEAPALRFVGGSGAQTYHNSPMLFEFKQPFLNHSPENSSSSSISSTPPLSSASTSEQGSPEITTNFLSGELPRYPCNDLPATLPEEFYLVYSGNRELFVQTANCAETFASNNLTQGIIERPLSPSAVESLASCYPGVPTRLLNPLRPDFINGPAQYRCSIENCNDILPGAEFAACNQHIDKKHNHIKAPGYKHHCEICRDSNVTGTNFARHMCKVHFKYHWACCRMCGHTVGFWSDHYKKHLKNGGCPALNNLMDRMQEMELIEKVQEDSTSGNKRAKISAETPAGKNKRVKKPKN